MRRAGEARGVGPGVERVGLAGPSCSRRGSPASPRSRISLSSWWCLFHAGCNCGAGRRRRSPGTCAPSRRDDFRRAEQFYPRRGSAVPARWRLQMTSSDQTTSTALVTASRKLRPGDRLGVARSGRQRGCRGPQHRVAGLFAPRAGRTVDTVVADVADPVVAGTLIEQYRPDTLVLNAGAAPLMRPVQHQT